MNNNDRLQRFVEAQERNYATALAELKAGRKQSHWMWYIFPQMRGLGHSQTAQYYGITNREEARAYLRHPVLGKRLEETCAALLGLRSNDAHQVFGSPDDIKLRSSMTLFAAVAEEQPVFQQVLEKFFGGKPDQATLEKL